MSLSNGGEDVSAKQESSQVPPCGQKKGGPKGRTGILLGKNASCSCGEGTGQRGHGKPGRERQSVSDSKVARGKIGFFSCGERAGNSYRGQAGSRGKGKKKR